MKLSQATFQYQSVLDIIARKDYEELQKNILNLNKGACPLYSLFQDKYGDTALIKYVSNGNIKHVKLLLEHGANINIKNKKGKTALNYARNKQMKNLLLEYGAI